MERRKESQPANLFASLVNSGLRYQTLETSVFSGLGLTKETIEFNVDHDKIQANITNINPEIDNLNIFIRDQAIIFIKKVKKEANKTFYFLRNKNLV